MTYPASAEIRQARNLVGFGVRMLQFIKNGMGQFRRDTFIGIDGKHQFTTGQVERPILLRTETRPSGREARKSAVEGKRESVRGEHRGRRKQKKKKRQEKTTKEQK